MSQSRFRVFVSSVVDGFKAQREAARRGVTSAGADPILVNEDHPAASESPRNACLDAVESCDIYIMLLGARGGSVTPSGRLVVEEEFECARARRMPTLVFIEDVSRDVDASNLIARVSDYTDGTFRKTFRSVAELERQVDLAVRRICEMMSQPITPDTVVTDRLAMRVRERSDPSLRLVIAPERREELMSPAEIESEEFLTKVFEVGHAGARALLNYSCPKTHRTEGAALVVEQTGPGGRYDSTDSILLSVDESGVLDVLAGVSNRRHAATDVFAANMVVLTEDIQEVCASVFGFAGRLFDVIDPYKRHQRFLYGVALHGLGFRQIARDVTPKSSYEMVISRGNEPLIAFPGTRVLTRRDLSGPGEEIARTVTLLERAARG